MFIMETNQFFLLLSCSVLLSLGALHVHADNHQKSSAMDFLTPLNGTRKGNIVRGLSQLKKYLSNLGYMDVDPIHSNDDSFDDNLEKAVRDYQTFFKLNVTGMLDAATFALITQPRCGVPDFIPTLLHRPQRDYHSLYTFFPGTPKWPPGKRNLTYSFPPGTLAATNKAISDATSLWASVSPFRFRYIPEYDKADIKISYQVKDHGDGSPFDGPLGILAHAFSPPDGRLHFDKDEMWVDGIVGGSLDIQTVGLHELGHVLGLGHSTDHGAIMWPYIGSGLRKLLAKDDIDGIKALYPS